MADNEERGLSAPTEAPSYLVKSAEDRLGVDRASKYQTVNRLSIIQSSSKSERKQEFGEGAVAMFPDGIKVCEPDGKIIVVPVLFFPTWEIWSDYADKDSDTILDQVFEEQHEIARRSKQKDLRTEKYGEGGRYTKVYVESLNLVVRIETGDAKGEMCILSFNKGEHRVGRTMAGMIRRSPTDIFGRRVELTISLRTGDNEWFGFDLNNPSAEDGGPWVAEADIPILEALHIEADAAYKARLIAINRDDDAPSGGGSGSSGIDDDDLPPV